MKKLTRKGIEAMKNEMPILSEDILRLIVAGAGYYSPTGELLNVTAGDEGMIYILGASGYTTLSQASTSDALSFITARAGDVFGYSGVVKITNESGVWAGLNQNGELCINPAYLDQMNNLYDLNSLLEHEGYHLSGSSGSGSSGSINTNEDDVYYNQVRTSTFAMASPAFKKATAENWYQANLSNGNSGMPLTSYYHLCFLDANGNPL